MLIILIELIFLILFCSQISLGASGRESSCDLSKHLSKIIATYSGEDILRAQKYRSKEWMAMRKEFRQSYVLSSESKNCMKAHPALEAAVDSFKFIVSIQLEQSDEVSIRSIKNELHPILNNLAAGEYTGIAIFVTIDNKQQESVNRAQFNTLCPEMTTGNCDYYVFSKNMYSFALHCASDIFVGGSLDYEVTSYVAGLCSPRVVLALDSNPQLQEAFNSVILFPLSNYPTPSNNGYTPEARISEQDIEVQGFSAGAVLQKEPQNDFLIDVIRREFAYGTTEGVEFRKNFDLASCRANEELEPVNPTVQSCQYRSVDISGIKSDFDAIRKAADLCEQEFSLGNDYNRRLWVSYKTPEACVHAMVGAWQNMFLGKARTSVEYTDVTSYSIDFSEQTEYIKHSSVKRGQTYDSSVLFDGIIQDRFSYESSCSPNWMWNLSYSEVKMKSQGGQDGVLQEILRNIGITNKYFGNKFLFTQLKKILSINPFDIIYMKCSRVRF